jgi:hypothetical protein
MKKDLENTPDKTYVFQLDKGEEIERFLAAFPEVKGGPHLGQEYAGPGEEDFAIIAYDAPKIKVTIELSYFKTK